MSFSKIIESVFDPFRFNRYMLQPYLLNDGKKHPFALICPGGGYGMVCSGGEGKPFAEKLNKLGYHAFVLRYHTKSKGRYPQPQQDVKRAAEEIFSHAEEWNVATEGWSLWGSSAGGHLAASYCAEKWDTPKPSALILCYPVITMGEYTHKGSKDNLLGKKAGADMIDRLSVEKNVSADYPPTYLWFGTADNAVPPINGEKLKSALAEASVECRMDLYEGIGHGAGMATGTAAEPWFNNAVEFWEKQRGK